MMVKPYVEKGMPLLYPRWYDDGEQKIDHNYVLFNRPSNHGEKIGVVVETMKGTAVVACRYFVRYKNFAKVVARVQRCWAHDEDSACVIGDVIHIRKASRRGKFKSFQGTYLCFAFHAHTLTHTHTQWSASWNRIWKRARG